MPDVFLSYSSKDKPWADSACAVLERNGVRCWIAPRDIVPGEEWGAAIIRGIASCKIMVLIFSTSANASPQVRREVERSINRDMPIIPMRIEEVYPSGSLEYALGNTHWLDAFTPPLEEKLERLAESAKAFLSILDQRPQKDPATSTSQSSSDRISGSNTRLARSVPPKSGRPFSRAILIGVCVAVACGMASLLYNMTIKNARRDQMPEATKITADELNTAISESTKNSPNPSIELREVADGKDRDSKDHKADTKTVPAGLDPPSKLEPELPEVSDVAIMFSCKKQQMSYEIKGLENGVFSHYLARHISDGDREIGRKGVALTRLVSYLRWSVEGAVAEARGPQVLQTPELKMDGDRGTRLFEGKEGYALLVGVNKTTSPRIPPLHYAEKDASDLGTALQQRGYKGKNMYILTSNIGYKATKSGILDRLQLLAQEVGPDSELLFFFSGNGVSYGSVGPCLIPMDGDVEHLETLLPLRDVERIMKQSMAHIKVMFIDACRDEGGR